MESMGIHIWNRYDQGIGKGIWRRLVNCFVSRIYVNKNLGRHGLLGNFLNMGSGDVLGAFILRWYFGGKDIDFGGEVTDLTKGEAHS